MTETSVTPAVDEPGATTSTPPRFAHAFYGGDGTYAVLYSQNPLPGYLQPIALPDVLDDTRVPSLPDPVPCRVAILLDAATLTNGNRDVEYGSPIVNLTAAGRLKRVLRECMTRDMSPGELEAWDMVLTKLARAATGSPKRDTYVDASAYAAIAGEIALAGE